MDGRWLRIFAKNVVLDVKYKDLPKTHALWRIYRQATFFDFCRGVVDQIWTFGQLYFCHER